LGILLSLGHEKLIKVGWAIASALFIGNADVLHSLCQQFLAFVSASPGLSHRKDTPPSPETVVCTDITYDNDQTLKIAAAITATLRTLCCHVFAPFALIFSARVHAQVGESQLDLLVPHCDARPWPRQ
jgi:hypothetical protein